MFSSVKNPTEVITSRVTNRYLSPIYPPVIYIMEHPPFTSMISPANETSGFFMGTSQLALFDDTGRYYPHSCHHQDSHWSSIMLYIPIIIPSIIPLMYG